MNLLFDVVRFKIAFFCLSFLIHFNTNAQDSRIPYFFQYHLKEDVHWLQHEVGINTTLDQVYDKILLGHELTIERPVEYFRAFYEAKIILESNRFTHTAMYADVLAELAEINYRIGDFQSSANMLLHWYIHPKRCGVRPVNALNTLGTSLSKLNRKNYALSVYQCALKVSLEHEPLFSGVILANIAYVIAELGDHDKALDLFHQALVYSKKFNLYEYVAQNNLFILREQARHDNWTEFDARYSEALSFIDSAKLYRPNKFVGHFLLYDLKHKYLKHQGDYKGAIHYLELAVEEQNIKLASQKALMILREEMNISKNKFDENLSIRNLNFKIYMGVAIGAILILFLVVAFLIFRYKSMKAFESKRQEIYKARQDLVKSELDSVKEELEQFRNASSEYEKFSHGSFIDYWMENKILTEKCWIVFQREFQVQYPDFLKYLNEHIARLTDAEKRMACLIRLNLNTLEISEILGISKESVRRTKLRLRAKIGLGSMDELNQFVFSIPINSSH